MRQNKRLIRLAAILSLLIAAITLNKIYNSYSIIGNLEYLNNHDHSQVLDLYLHSGSKPRPTLIYFHGGGWAPPITKDNIPISHLPFLWLGWNIVNVEYRRSDSALAPGAVEDGVCALRWVFENSTRYRFDPQRIVLMGTSAGGSLALLTGMIPSSSTMGRECPDGRAPSIAAIIDWAGITALNDLLDGPNRRNFAVSWIGDQPDRTTIVDAVSPMTYVRAGLPPMFIVHGDADPVVPVAHSQNLHTALDRTGVSNRLILVPEGRHSDFGKIATLKVYIAMLRFLKNSGVEISP